MTCAIRNIINFDICTIITATFKITLIPTLENIQIPTVKIKYHLPRCPPSNSGYCVSNPTMVLATGAHLGTKGGPCYTCCRKGGVQGVLQGPAWDHPPTSHPWPLSSAPRRCIVRWCAGEGLGRIRRGPSLAGQGGGVTRVPNGHMQAGARPQQN